MGAATVCPAQELVSAKNLSQSSVALVVVVVVVKSHSLLCDNCSSGRLHLVASFKSKRA